MNNHYVKKKWDAEKAYLTKDFASQTTFITSMPYIPQYAFHMQLYKTSAGKLSSDYYKFSSISAPNASYIETNAFGYAKNLTNASFPACTSIGSWAFDACGNLSSIDITNCVTISTAAFRWCSNLSYVSLPNCSIIGESAFTHTNLNALDFYNCTEVGSYAFSECSNLTTVVLDNCSKIGYYAFHSCSNLSYVSLNSLTENDTIFGGCYNLNTVYLPNMELYDYFGLGIPQSAPLITTGGNGCKYLYVKGVGISSSIGKLINGYVSQVSSFPDNTVGIRGSSYIVASEISNSTIYAIIDGFRSSETSVNKITLTTSEPIYIGPTCFSSNTALKELNFPNTVKTLSHSIIFEIGDPMRATALTSVYLDNWDGHIGQYAFFGCTSLSTVYAPNCTGLSTMCFCETALASVSFPACSFVGGGIFREVSTKTLYMPMLDIGSRSANYIFGDIGGYNENYAYSTLQQATIGNLSLCSNFFESYNALSVVTLAKCSYIGSSAFYNCSNLSRIYLPSTDTCSLNTSLAFNGTLITSSTGYICVHSSNVSWYKSAPEWSYFFSRIVNKDKIVVRVIDCDTLTITAEDCLGRESTTVVHYIADCNVEYEDGTTGLERYIGDDISADFGTNPSTTHSRQVTVSYTYLNKTATTTVTQGPNYAYSWEIVENPEESGSDYYFTLDTATVPQLDTSVYAGLYKSNNSGVHNSYAVSRIDVSGYTELVVWINSNANSITVYGGDSDYTIAGQIDADYPTISSEGYDGNGYSTGVSSKAGNYTNTKTFEKAANCGNIHTTTLNTNYWRRIVYALDGAPHSIYITFKKDASYSTSPDAGWFTIEIPTV